MEEQRHGPSTVGVEKHRNLTPLFPKGHRDTRAPNGDARKSTTPSQKWKGSPEGTGGGSQKSDFARDTSIFGEIAGILLRGVPAPPSARSGADPRPMSWSLLYIRGKFPEDGKQFFMKGV